MVDPKDLARIVREFTGRDLSGQDLYDYGYFLKGAEDVFDAEKRERIRSELASIVMHNPGLAKKVAEEYGFVILQGIPEPGLKLSLLDDKKYSKSALEHLNNQKLVMASLPDIYSYFKSLVALHEEGDYKQVEQAGYIVQVIRNRYCFITSTKVFFRTRSLDAQIVHYFNVQGREPQVANILVPEIGEKSLTEAMNDPAGQRYVQVLLGTNDGAKEIADTFNFIFNKDAGKLCVSAPLQKERLAWLQAIGGIHRELQHNDRFAVGLFYETFEGYPFFIGEPKK